MKKTTALLLSLSFLTGPMAHASAQSVLDKIRGNYFIIAGYPSSIVSNGPPQDGLISFVDFFATSAQTIAATNGVASCTAVPATGTASASVTIPTALQNFLGATGTFTMTYATPVVTVPAGWSGAGSLFQKRVQLTKAGSIAFAMEFNCNTNELFATISIPGDNIDSSTRDLNLYISKNGTATTADFLMTVTKSSRTELIDSQMVRLVTTDGVTFKVWNTTVTMRDTTHTCGGGSCGNQYSYERSVIHGNATTKIASLYTKMSSPDLTGASTISDRKALIAESSLATAAVSGHDFSASEPNQGAGTIEKSGCVNFVSQADPADGSYCVGVGASLTAPATSPLADITGDFTVNWVKTTLPSKMKWAN